MGNWGWVLNAILSRAKSFSYENESHKTRVKKYFSRYTLPAVYQYSTISAYRLQYRWRKISKNLHFPKMDRAEQRQLPERKSGKMLDVFTNE